MPESIVLAQQSVLGTPDLEDCPRKVEAFAAHEDDTDCGWGHYFVFLVDGHIPSLKYSTSGRFGGGAFGALGRGPEGGGL